ncbi:MAG: hypothetical protein FWF33_00890 [Clostridiales bacterium]|nr:hypothetical protein [Clostridiales bacterium]
MNSVEFLQYTDDRMLYRKFILIAPSKEMLTKKGAVRRKWLNAFFGKEEKGFTLPKAGGCLEEGIIIFVPDIGAFYLMSYNKDISGWRTYIEKVAAYRNTLYAEVKGGNLLLSNGKQILIRDCQISDYNPIPS